VAFAELGGFIDDAVQSYSTGMKARLAYAAAAQLRPDILLIDEALAVGDFAFQRKCVRHMRDFVQAGGALILISHNSHQVQAVCGRGILLERGRVVLDGSAVEALSTMYDRPAMAQGKAEATATGPIAITDLTISGVATGEPADVVLRYRADAPVQVSWGFQIWTDDRERCVTGANAPRPRRLATGSGELRCRLPRLPLIAGRYRLEAALLEPDTQFPLARIGHLDGGLPLHVPARADPLTNLRVKSGQLVELDVIWSGDGA
jgi:hypothetical protein